MAKRFGRNQKRQLRAKIDEMQATINALENAARSASLAASRYSLPIDFTSAALKDARQYMAREFAHRYANEHGEKIMQFVQHADFKFEARRELVNAPNLILTMSIPAFTLNYTVQNRNF